MTDTTGTLPGRSAAPVTDRFDDVVRDADRVALPGQGRTWERFEYLAALAADDLSLARLVEGHTDALAILAESGRGVAHTGARYGVWAARGGPDPVRAEPGTDGWWLTGRKPFCSGTGLLDRALVTVEATDGYRLVDVAVADVVTGTVPGSWPAVGMADSCSLTVEFNGPVARQDAVGTPDFYTRRPGFWFGACGVAACWFGGARGLVAGVVQALPADAGDLALAELGRAVAHLQAAEDVLRRVARAIDDDPGDVGGGARARALAVRQVVHDCCEVVLRLTASAGGARPLCHDAAQARRAADLYVYLAQHHGPADAAELGRLALGARP